MIEKFKNYLRRRFIKWLVKDLFCALDKDSVLKIERERVSPDRVKTTMYFRGKSLSQVSVDGIRVSATEFARSDIWRVLSQEVKYQASQMMFETATTEYSMIFGKAALWNLKVMEKKINEIVNS